MCARAHVCVTNSIKVVSNGSENNWCATIIENVQDSLFCKIILEAEVITSLVYNAPILHHTTVVHNIVDGGISVF